MLQTRYNGEKHDLKGKSGELVFIADGLPLIPKKIVAKIVNGEYVDLAELLPRKTLLEDNAFTEVAESY